MRKIFALLMIILLAGTNSDAQARQKPKMEIGVVSQVGETVHFAITSSQPLIFSNNRYVLYIGNSEFTRSETPEDENNRRMSFLISAKEFRMLKDGSNMYLSYGRINTRDRDMESYAQRNRRCWSLGKFSKTILKK